MKYFNVKSYDDFVKNYGQYWANLLWEISVTWGDEVVWQNKNGEEQRGVLALLTGEGGLTYYGIIWGTQGDNANRPIYLWQIEKAAATGKHYDANDLASVLMGSQCGVQMETCSDALTDYYYIPVDYIDVHAEYYAALFAGYLIPGAEVSAWVKFFFGGTALQIAEVVGDHVGFTSSYYWEHTFASPSGKYLTIVLTTNPVPPSFSVHWTIPGNDWLFGGN